MPIFWDNILVPKKKVFLRIKAARLIVNIFVGIEFSKDFSFREQRSFFKRSSRPISQAMSFCGKGGINGIFSQRARRIEMKLGQREEVLQACHILIFCWIGVSLVSIGAAWNYLFNDTKWPQSKVVLKIFWPKKL